MNKSINEQQTKPITPLRSALLSVRKSQRSSSSQNGDLFLTAVASFGAAFMWALMSTPVTGSMWTNLPYCQEHVLLSSRLQWILRIKTWCCRRRFKQNIWQPYLLALGRHNTSSMETCHMFFFVYIRVHGHNLLSLGRILSLPETQKQWCGLKHVTINMRGKGVIFQFRVNYPLEFNKYFMSWNICTMYSE